MNVVLVDTNWQRFLPVSFTRPVSQLRCGILKIYEKWEMRLNLKSVAVSEEYLNQKFFSEVEGSTLIINSMILPDDDLVKAVLSLKDKEILNSGGTWLAIRSESGFNKDEWADAQPIEYPKQYKYVDSWWDLYKQNGSEIEKDFSLITAQKKSRPLSSSNVLIGPKNKLFIEEGAYIEGCVLNTDFGSVYIGKNAEVMEGSIIRGGFSVLEESKIKLGTKIYGPTSIGPKCRVGGEVKNSIFQGYSNKSHDGYLGNSIIGEWVNLGADTNCSNLKNTFSSAKVWSYEEKKMVDSGELFLGCCIGDFSKTGINTMINTASVIGVNANLFGSGFQKKFVPSFSWGERETYTLSKAWEVNKNIARLTGEELSDEDHLILQAIHSYQL
ncbi:MAG: glucose-1-phosphate thymidylyltransferase [Flavobacteriales bacterium]|nr:glucose-1-phosphate thymidylyltransferase [Flavobacteriales bacterium]|tara:strand:- start:16557 stop:17708 length:1152 start_codon:yes stop_codon:yes gene_type:complete